MFATQCTKNNGGRAVAMVMLTASTNITHNAALTVLAGKEKKEEYANPHTKGVELVMGRLGLPLWL